MRRSPGKPVSIPIGCFVLRLTVLTVSIYEMTRKLNFISELHFQCTAHGGLTCASVVCPMKVTNKCELCQRFIRFCQPCFASRVFRCAFCKSYVLVNFFIKSVFMITLKFFV